MTSVIPAPHHFKESDEHGSIRIDANSVIEAGPETQFSKEWLTERLGHLAGIQLTETGGNGARINLRIDNVHELIPITSGIRPDGGTAHDEGYSITVNADGIEIIGMSAEAVFRGVTTLLQLVVENPEIAFGTIMDAPRLAWRGLSFDTVRTFHSVETVKKVLDLLALYKFNVLHFHLTDSEGWRFEVENWPSLTEISGQTARDDRPGGYYTTEEFADLVQYAADRFIRVIPEFDSPGHTASVLTAYPELGTEEIRSMDPAMQYLHPDQPGLADLQEDVYAAMAQQTNGAYIHVGGDEAIAMDHADFQRYMEMALPLARKTGKGIVAWQEAARGGLSNGDLVQWWIPDQMVQKIRARLENPTEEDIARAQSNPVYEAYARLFSTADEDVPMALDQGANVILSPSTWLYLDTKYPEESADPEQKDQHERVGMPVRVYDNGTVADSYNWDPATIYPTVSVDRIAGVEAAIWCETIENEDDLFFQLLPRLAGVAEKAWSDHREWEDHRARLAKHPVFWDKMGITWFKSSVVW